MLTSFLRKSRPIHALIFASVLVLSYLVNGLRQEEFQSDYKALLTYGVTIFVIFLLLFLLDFIIKKNDLTEKNAFGMFFFTVFGILFIDAFSYSNIVFAAVFLLLAVRRIISLDKNTRVANKILDASLWITLASLFHFWSMLFFIPLWIAIVLKSNANYKQMLMPFVGVFMIALIAIASRLLIDDSLQWFLTWDKTISLDFSAYNNPLVLIPTLLVLGLFVWTVIVGLFNKKTRTSPSATKYALLLTITFGLLAVALASAERSGAEMVFVLAPISVFVANYFEKEPRKESGEKNKAVAIFKESLLWMLLLVALGLLVI